MRFVAVDLVDLVVALWHYWLWRWLVGGCGFGGLTVGLCFDDLVF